MYYCTSLSLPCLGHETGGDRKFFCIYYHDVTFDMVSIPLREINIQNDAVPKEWLCQKRKILMDKKKLELNHLSFNAPLRIIF